MTGGENRRSPAQMEKPDIYIDEKGCQLEPTWKDIEVRALELGDFRLHQEIKDQDLYAKEAHTTRNAVNPSI